MRTNKLFILFIFLFTSLIYSSEKKIITGEFTWNEWKANCEWKSLDSVKFIPNQEVILKIKEKLKEKNYSFYIFAGSWCGDSETELPKIFTILDLLNIKQSNIRLIGVDRDKDEPSHLSKILAIMKVPTVIISRNDSEIGRIIEFPVNKDKSWEIDLLDIISK
jgi:hypothetical protein